MKRMLRFAIIGVVIAVGGMVGYAQFGLRAAQTGVSATFEHQGRPREYRLHVPEGLEPGDPVPLLVCLHGGGSNSRVASAMGFSKLADRKKFIVAYPNAIEKHWNDGRDSPMFADQDDKVDDVDFIMKIVQRIRRSHSIDANRIFATGVSNGGFMTQRLAMEKPETFSAVAVCIATMGEAISQRFDPALPVSVLYLNGTEDPLVPYDGGPVGKGLGPRLNRVAGNPIAPRGLAISTDDAVQLWVERNKTASEPTVKKLADKNQEDRSYIEYYHWDGGQRGTVVGLYKVVGGGHALPGGRQYYPVKVIGRPNQDAQGPELVWDFLIQHPRQPKPSSTE
ncbi:Esterase PHB depolymerase [Rosistilla ulvae]|uniref:Esterase PHB depolymerase n=1 Tax=Rosistilla ulvae TaxID=1930277 RepID=A0A517M3Q4_9BACT|nr:PHB depolymerase family esterase [Rosistilla ulvae]QDS89508.1 Esterase PHB depolymerase [Rosistilla ulvae]